MIASGQSSGSTSGLVTGLFRRLIDLALADDLLALDAAGLAAAVEEVDVAELPQRIGELASTWVAKALADVHEDDRPAAAQQLATELMAAINRTSTTADPLLAQDETLASPISELTAIEPLDPTGNIIPIKRPLTPIGDTVLLTNARGEPTLSKEIEAEIDSADRIDIVLAFIRWTGIRNLITALTETPRRRQTSAGHHHHLHRLNRGQGARQAAGPGRRGQGQLRHDHHPAACQGVALPS